MTGSFSRVRGIALIYLKNLRAILGAILHDNFIFPSKRNTPNWSKKFVSLIMKISSKNDFEKLIFTSTLSASTDFFPSRCLKNESSLENHKRNRRFYSPASFLKALMKRPDTLHWCKRPQKLRTMIVSTWNLYFHKSDYEKKAIPRKYQL